MLVDVVSDKIQFCDTEEAFVGVDDDAMLVEAVENRSQVFEVLFEGVASDEDVVDVYVGEGDTKKNNEFPMTKIVQQICNIGHISLMWVS